MTTHTLIHLRNVPVPVEAEARKWEQLFLTVHRPGVQEQIERIALEMAVSPGTARRKFDDWRKLGFEALIPRQWRSESARSGLNVDFIEYMAGLTQEHGNFVQGYRKFLREFFAGSPIPGVETGVSRNRLPVGFQPSNIRKKLAKHASPFQLAAARVGLRAAAAYRPLVRTTRAEMEPGMDYQMDDMWHNFKVVVLGQKEPCRVLALHALDVCSGCVPALILKPQLWAEDKRISLKEHEALFFTMHLLHEHGFHPNGCTLTMEGGTMTIRDEEVRDEIHAVSGCKVIVECGQGSNDTATAGQYRGASEGNFRRKAHLESWHNILQNWESDVMQFLGQTGKNSRLDKPEELAGREREANALVKWAEKAGLPERLRETLNYGFLHWHDADKLIHAMVDRINDRKDHTLEGWEEAGFITSDLMLPGGQMITLAEAEAHAAKLAPEMAACWRAGLIPVPRRMSPAEVFARGRTKLVRFDERQVARVLYRARRGEPVKIGKDHEIVVQDKSIAPDPLVYWALGYTPGEKFEAVINPFSPGKIFLFDAHGVFVGACEMHGAVSRVDTKGIEEQMKRAAHQQALLLQPVKQRAAVSTTALRLKRTRENLTTLAEHVGLAAEAESQAGEDRELRKKLLGM